MTVVTVLEGELLSAQPTVTGAELAANGSLFPVETLGRIYGVTGDELLNLLNPEASQQAYTSDATLTANDIDLLLTNYLAAGLVTLTLPQATVGAAFSGSRQSDQPFRFRPYGAEKFLGGDPGGYLEILDYGDIAGYCYIAGQWTIYAESQANVWRLENGFQGVSRALGVYRVKDFGADRTGSVDSTAAIQACRTQAFASPTPATILFDPGDYLVTNASLIEAFDDLTVSGYGATIVVPSSGVTVRDASATDTYTYDNGLIYKTDGDVSNLKVLGLTLETALNTVSLIGIGDSGSTAGSIVGSDISIEDCRQEGGNAWTIIGCRNLKIERNTIMDTYSTSLFVPNNENTSIRANTLEFIGVDRAYADWNNVAAISGNNNKSLTVENNRIEASGGTTIIIRAAQKPITDICIRGNTLLTCGQSAIEARVRSDATNNSYLRNVTVTGNSIHGFLCAKHATTLTVAAAAAALTVTVASTEGFDSGSTISILLADASTHTTTINGTPVGFVVTITVAIPAAGASNGAAVSVGASNHNGIDVGTDKSAYKANGIIVSDNVVNFISQQETWDVANFEVDGSANIHKSKNRNPGSAHGILIFGTGVSGAVEDFVVNGNTILHCPRCAIETSYAVNGTISGNTFRRNGWQRDASNVPYGSAHAIFTSISAVVNITNNTVHENNPGCDGAASSRTVIVQTTDSYLINVTDNVLSSNDTLTAASSWNATGIGFTCGAATFTLDGFTTRTCQTYASGNRVFGTYFGLVTGGVGSNYRHYSSAGFLTVKEDDYVAVITATNTALIGATTILAAHTGALITITLPNPSLIPNQTVVVKHQGLSANNAAIATAAGTINGVATIATDAWATYRAVGSVWEQIV